MEQNSLKIAEVIRRLSCKSPLIKFLDATINNKGNVVLELQLLDVPETQEEWEQLGVIS